MIELVALTVADMPATWSTLGFRVEDGAVTVGRTRHDLIGSGTVTGSATGTATGIVGWSLRGGGLDGVTTVEFSFTHGCGESPTKELRIQLAERLDVLPPALAGEGLELLDGGNVLRYEYDTRAAPASIAPVLGALTDAGIRFRDLDTRQSSLEEIFVDIVGGQK